MKDQLRFQSDMGAALRKGKLELLLFKEDTYEAMDAGGSLPLTRLNCLHFPVFFELEHLVQSLQTAPKQQPGLL